ncbi:unnamed protein product [Rhizoctonia solani]|uniref:Uncharacterized protein n=1 Tax=Rhizoctonia solani TaxID=456999 RepID=A0A8H3CU80_9AGAM|nr:unnamed protein product [Rhizoctonia solani]
MAAPSLQPPALDQALGTPAAEWAQETVEAIGPDASTGVVTDSTGNPTTDHNKSALAGEPGYGANSEKTAALLQAQRSTLQPVSDRVPVTQDEKTPTNERPQTEPARKVYTDVQGNPTTDPSANALSSTPGTGEPLPSATNKSLPPTPAQQLPGGWIRGPESRAHSVIIPETSLYEDVSAALGTVGKAAFSALPASVVGSLSNGQPQHEANGSANATQAQAPATSVEESKPGSSPPRSGSPGLLSRAQGMITGLLARPASPAAKLPATDAPTTTGEAALVGGGAVAETANRMGDNIAAGQDLGGHDPKGVKEDEQPGFEKVGTGNVTSPHSESANTAAQFMNAGVPTPDLNQPPKDPGVAGSVFPHVPDDGKKGKSKGSKLGTTLSPDSDVQEAAKRSNQDFSVPVTGPGSPDVKSQLTSENDQLQPTMTRVSDSGVKSKLMDAKDIVAAPFAGSRASEELARPKDLTSPSSPGRANKSLSPTDQSRSLGANPEGIRTTANPHTAHTGLPPTKEEASAKHVGGTPVIGGGPTSTKAAGEATTGIDRKGTASITGDKETTSSGDKETAPSAGATEEATGNASGGHIGMSSRGGDGHEAFYGDEGAAISQRSAPGSPNKGVSRLWSRSRRSVDEGTTGTKSSRSKFTEEPSNGSDSASATSPTSSRFKVPLKDKIKGELKIISGKVSRNEAKVEQGIALKTGQDPHSPTSHKH